MNPLPQSEIDRIESEAQEHAEISANAYHEKRAYITGATREATASREREKEAIDKLINTPQTADFIEAVKCEMVHQQERWGDESAKHPHDFALVLSYLQGKLIKSIFEGDADKFLHHVITTAAVAGVIHKYFNEQSNTRLHFYPPSNPIQQQ